MTTSVFSALIALPLSAQPAGSDELRRLQDENASLRKRVSDAEAKATTPASSETQRSAPAEPVKQNAFGMEFGDEVLLALPFRNQFETGFWVSENQRSHGHAHRSRDPGRPVEHLRSQ
ncbi:MAG: hypothetical protein QM760_03290 [Nibricoccus sp.]